jgi:hypothetical protein
MGFDPESLVLLLCSDLLQNAGFGLKPESLFVVDSLAF